MKALRAYDYNKEQKMQQLKVSSDGSAQYTTIQSALDAARLDDVVTVYIYNGVYREKLVCSHPNATLVGESRDAVLLTGADGGKHFDAQGQPCIHIRTLEGWMTATLGDYVIKGIAGEFYPCKPDIFEATYEDVGAEL